MLRVAIIFSVLYFQSIALRVSLGPQWGVPTPENARLYGALWLLEYEGTMLLISSASGGVAISISLLFWGGEFLVKKGKFLATVAAAAALNFPTFRLLNFLIFSIT